MGFKAMVFLLAYVLSVTAGVSSNGEEFLMEKIAVPAHVPIQAPAPAPQVMAPVSAPKPPPIKTRMDCIPPCTERCKRNSRKGLCLRACMSCCDRCKCVPPGTYGNREKCGKCYTDMTTRGDKSKCP